MRLPIALAALLVAASPQDTITLQSQPRKGDTVAEQHKVTMKLKLAVLAGGQKVDLEIESRESEKKTVEFQEVAAGKVTRARFEFEECIEEKRPPGAEELVRSEKPLHGKKVTVESRDGKTTYDGADGLDDKSMKSLKLDNEFSKVFPAKPVGVGESWEVGGEVIRTLFENQEMDGKMTLKLTEVKDFEGHRSAFLATELDLKGKAEAGIDIAAKLKGTIVVWIERGYTLRIKLDGRISMSGKTNEAELSGEGPMTVEVSAKVK